MTAEARAQVRERAGNRCEYCGLRQEQLRVVPFHIEHIRSRKHGGGDELGNLALACHQCNLHKGANLSGVDPESGEIVDLFDPRLDDWEANFSNEAGRILGRTPRGRATVEVLAMNTEDRIRLRISAFP